MAPMRAGRHRLAGSHGERGTTLVEALIAFLVLSLGLVAISRVEAQLRLSGETARQRSEAVRLAQEDIEHLRSFSSTAPSGGGGHDFADVVTGSRTLGQASGYASNTVYRLDRRVVASSVPAARNLSVSVAWTDRAGELQAVTLESILAANDPALSGALGLAPAAAVVNGPKGRAIGIPLVARDLGDGRSAFAPAAGSAPVFVFDNTSGVIGERCSLAAGATYARSAADLSTCTRVTAYLLSGIVRFVSAADDRAGPVMSATVTVTPSGDAGSMSPECSATAVSTPAGDRYLQYGCIVYPLPSGRWSGQTRLVPDGWTLGSGRSSRQICAYHANASATSSPSLVTAAAKPPDSNRLGRYVDVSGSLVNQNFRVVPGDLPCPA